MSWLYRYEVKGIQDWILATGKLLEIQGASALLERLPQRMELVIERACGVGPLREYAGRPTEGVARVMSAAGNATLLFPNEHALARFAAVWPMEVAAHAPGVTLVQAWVEGESPAALTQVFRKLGERRNLRPPDLPEAGPLVLRTGRTGLPAVGEDDRDGLLDLATCAKRAANQAAGSRAADPLAARVGIPEDRPPVTDLEQFGEGYLAVLHADGNGIGQKIQNDIQTLSDQHLFSRALGAATEAAAREACDALLDGTPREGRWRTRSPIRPVVLGGDDLTVILRAQDALAFAERYVRAFEQTTEEEMGKAGLRLSSPFTACAGVAMIKPHWPFVQAHDLAVDLCDAAKKGLRRDDGQTASGLLFHRVTTALSGTWDAVCEAELATPATQPQGLPGRLTGGPYALGGVAAPAGVTTLENLHALASESRTLPRGALREWVRLVKADPNGAEALMARTAEVAGQRDREAWTRFSAALARCGCAAGGDNRDLGWTAPGDGGPGRGAQRATPLLDVLTWRSADPGLVRWQEGA